MVHPAQKICYAASSLYFAIGQTISVCHEPFLQDAKTLWSAEPVTAAEKSKNISNRSVIDIAVHGQYLAWIAEDKMLRVYDIKTGNLQSERELVKRGCSIDIAEDVIVVGDKFGDVYQFPIVAAESQIDVRDQKPVLGHVSMLTKVLLARMKHSKRAIITADRDEHIRVSSFPDGYNILHYCLGHTQFVSALALSADHETLISGGGDEYIGVWSTETGLQSHRIALNGPSNEAKDSGTNLAVLKLVHLTASSILVVCAGLRTIYLYETSSEGKQLATLRLEAPALDLAVLSGNRIMVSHDTAATEASHKLFSHWQIIEDMTHAVNLQDMGPLNQWGETMVNTGEYVSQNSDLLRKRTKAEIEEARLAKLKQDEDEDEDEHIDKDLKRAIEDDKAHTESMLKKAKIV